VFAPLTAHPLISLYLAYLPRFLVLPVPARLKRPVELDGPGTGAVDRTAAAVPALFGMQNDRRLPFLGMGYIDIDLADLDTYIASGTDVGIEQHWLVGCRNIGNCEYIFLCHVSLH
jgi:hypothetical protein